jgi:hypothetical protein
MTSTIKIWFVLSTKKAYVLREKIAGSYTKVAIFPPNTKLKFVEASRKDIVTLGISVRLLTGRAR